jgi:preprotein translocase subunit SecA
MRLFNVRLGRPDPDPLIKVPDDVPIEAKMVTNAIRSAQTQVEEQNFEIRKNVLKYDDVMNAAQGDLRERREVSKGEDLREEQIRLPR